MIEQMSAAGGGAGENDPRVVSARELLVRRNWYNLRYRRIHDDGAFEFEGSKDEIDGTRTAVFKYHPGDEGEQGVIEMLESGDVTSDTTPPTIPDPAPPAAPVSPAAGPAMPAAAVIPPAPTGDASTMTGDQLAAFNAQMRERSTAMQLRVVELEGLLRQVQAAQAAGTAVPEQYAGVLAERDALRRIHGLGDEDASRVLQIAHEKFAPQAIPADATPEQRERIERSNALSAKTLRTLEKRRYELRVKAEKIPTDAGKGAILDVLRNHLALPWWKRFGSSAAITGIGALTGYGAMSALTTYAGLGTLAFLGSLAGAPLLTGGAIVGGTFAHLYKRFHHQNAIGQGRSALLHKSPTTSAAVLSLLIGGAKFAAWNTAAGQTIIGALGGKLSQLTHGAFDSILHMFSSGPRPRMPIGKGPTLRL